MATVPTERIMFAHYLRGVGALMVVIAHLLGAFWDCPYRVAPLINATAYHPNPPLLIKLILFKPTCHDYGRFGVALFFLISGFVIPYSINRLNSKQFLITRFFRIWPTYWLGFSLTLISLLIAANYYHQPVTYSAQHLVSQFLILRDIFGFTSLDGISWTLEIEIKFYLLCVLLRAAIINTRLDRIIMTCMVMLLISIITFNFPPQYLPDALKQYWLSIAPLIRLDGAMMTFMLIGTIFYFIYQKKITAPKALSAILILFSLHLFQWCLVYPTLRDKIRDFDCLLALLVFTLAFFYTNKIKVPKIVNQLANISYPLYVVHSIVGCVVMRITLDLVKSPYLVILAGLSTSIVLATLIHKYVEIPTNQLGKKIANKLALRARAEKIHDQVATQ